MRIIKRYDPFHKKYTFYIAEDLYKDIREKVLKRDNNKCFICGRNERLAVHHKDLSGRLLNYEKPNNDLSNLVTLCIYCHGKAHEDYFQKLGRRYL